MGAVLMGSAFIMFGMLDVQAYSLNNIQTSEQTKKH